MSTPAGDFPFSGDSVASTPVADAGAPQTVRSGTPVTLDGSGSADSDGDPITFQWAQVGGPDVTLSDPEGATPSFTAPPVGGSATLLFQLTVSDGALESEPAEVAVTVENEGPRCDLAQASPALLWPPNHGMRRIAVTNVTDPGDAAVVVRVTGVTQDEPVAGLEDDTSPDAVLQGATALVRAERSGAGTGRVYRVQFTADDGVGGTCAGSVEVVVPKSMKRGQGGVDDGQLYDSAQPE